MGIYARLYFVYIDVITANVTYLIKLVPITQHEYAVYQTVKKIIFNTNILM